MEAVISQMKDLPFWRAFAPSCGCDDDVFCEGGENCCGCDDSCLGDSPCENCDYGCCNECGCDD